MIWAVVVVLVASSAAIARLTPAERRYLETRRRAEAMLATLNGNPEETK